MSGLRIKRETAELVALPPTEWTVKTVEWLLQQDTIQKNIHRVGINEPLLKSIERDGMLNPILVMPSWYPIVGSQRIRIYQELKTRDPNHPRLQDQVRVARFEKEYWNMFYLWKSEKNPEFSRQAIAVWFQTVELAWKSIHHIENTDKEGFSMQEFEEIGDRTKWNISEEEKKRYAI